MSNASQTFERGPIDEGDSGVLSFILEDENEDPVAKAAIDSLTLDLRHLEPVTAGALVGAIINGREDQDVLNDNDVTMHATSGLVTFNMTPEDNPWNAGSGSRFVEEKHIAIFRAVWDDGAKAKTVQVVITVRVGRSRFAD